MDSNLAAVIECDRNPVRTSVAARYTQRYVFVGSTKYKKRKGGNDL